MTFASTLAPDDVMLLGSVQPVLGTVMLGGQHGAIRRAVLTRNGKRQEFETDAGELLLVLITNPGWTLTLECLFDYHVTAPGIMDEIVLPFLEITGRVMEGVTVEWEDGKERILQIPAAQWDSMEGVATAYRLTTAGAAVDIPAPEGPAPTFGGWLGGIPLSAAA